LDVFFEQPVIGNVELPFACVVDAGFENLANVRAQRGQVHEFTGPLRRRLRAM